MGKNDADILARQRARRTATEERIESNPKVSSKTRASSGGTTGIKRAKK